MTPLVQANGNDGAVLEAYGAYKQAVASGDLQQTVEHARRTYQLALAELTEEDARLPTLALNLGSALENLGASQPVSERQALYAEAHRRYKDALKQLKGSEGDHNDARLEALIGLAKTAEKPRRAEDYYQHAVDLSKTAPVQQATIQLWAYDQLKTHSETVRSAKQHLRAAVETLQAERPEDDSRRLEAEFRLAVLMGQQGKRETAIAEVERILVHYQRLDFTHPMALGAHSLLVNWYEQNGEREQATAHCLAIGKMRPWQDDQEQIPLYRVNPEYPVNMARRGREGYVVMDFTVDEQGFVIDPKIAESSNRSFEKVGLEALKQWRYAPRFEEGQAVKGESRVRLDFTIKRS
ncbi:energy transducer TonB [Marinobacter hydrocarbonoclasticus]|nr:energy transducer TonB [Marinobacter nauticus]